GAGPDPGDLRGLRPIGAAAPPRAGRAVGEAMSPLRVIDVDGHLAEPPGIWGRYLDARYQDFAPRWVRDNRNRRRLLVGGELKPYVPFPPGPALIDIT